MSSSSSWFPFSVVSSRQAREDAVSAAELRDLEQSHKKRLTSILRYVASMHQALRSADGSASGPSFVRSMTDEEACSATDFFQIIVDTNNNNHSYSSDDDDDDRNGVLFSTNDFRKLLQADTAMEAGASALWSTPPFSFYASSSSSNTASGSGGQGNRSSFSSSLSSSFGYGGKSKTSSTATPSSQRKEGQGLWLRLTRLGPTAIDEQPEIVPAVDNYLQTWLKESPPRGCTTIQDLLTLSNLERAPGIPSTTSSRHARVINSFLQRQKRYLRMKLFLNILEPIYGRLFEWIQQQNEHNEELVWGLGHAKLRTSDGRYVNGPLLEVLVEVELAKDGAILVRPREHTGVTLNREVVSALVNSAESPTSFAGPSSSTGRNVVKQLHRTISEMDSSQLSPGQPATYVNLLKKIAVEISPGGAFQQSASSSGKKTTRSPPSNLIVSEAWCMYTRMKPSSVWARDANLLADKIQMPDSPLPLATWSLTYGPSKLEQVLEQYKRQELTGRKTASQAETTGSGIVDWLSDNFLEQTNTVPVVSSETNDSRLDRVDKPIFPLATSDSQQRIANLLMRQGYPAVLAEGPPGTGKTHTIANIVSAYLCQGKRVLVTSKNANALNVLRGRLPKTVQELAVDVTMSESQGMRQLQQTVQRLADRMSAVSSEVETEKCTLLQRSIENLEAQLEDIDQQLIAQSEKLRHLLYQPSGLKLMEKSSDLICNSPWLMRTIQSWNLEETEIIHKELEALSLDQNDPIGTVSNFDFPPSRALISAALSRSGSKLSSLATATRSAVASIPLVGKIIEPDVERVDQQLERILIKNTAPRSEDDWKIIANALEHAMAAYLFQTKRWNPLVASKGWPKRNFREQSAVSEMSELLSAAVDIKSCQRSMNAEQETAAIAKFREMDDYRTRLTTQIKFHSEELADAAVVARLSKSFDPDAQGALIRFSQIAGTAKFNKSAKPSKMTARQRRKRSEYLDAFDRCCRFIPCWILTTSQISDYLPAECLFDLVVIDECSQSDVTVLPSMMRGKQWLIVGDGKQVSPTENFVSEDDIDNLRATLPSSPLGDALLPGRSFFDMCAQAFPRGRVVLSEHFRCAPEIIQFSNAEFYDGRLVPLRLPKKAERLTPSLVDVRVKNGMKVGKVNEAEVDRIVEMIQQLMVETAAKPRSIGVISLMGEEQSRLIRTRLLDVCGPENIAKHEVLIGEPPSFQGAERDVVFLSMVCSPGSSPTQNQQFHFQRANVAMSRARDRCVLVRSLDLKDIPSLDDAKIPIIEFFMRGQQKEEDEVDHDMDEDDYASGSVGKKRYGSSLLKFLLENRGYTVVDMSSVWKGAICVEHSDSDTRVGIMVDCEESSQKEWLTMYSQSKAIERVGWKTFRVDALSLVIDHLSVLNETVRFLSASGIPEPQRQKVDIEEEESAKLPADDPAIEHQNIESDESIDGDDGGDSDKSSIHTSIEHASNDGRINASTLPNRRQTTSRQPSSSSIGFNQDEPIDASRFGEVMNMDFLMRRESSNDMSEESDDGEDNGRNENSDRMYARKTSRSGQSTASEKSEKSASRRSKKARQTPSASLSSLADREARTSNNDEENEDGKNEKTNMTDIGNESNGQDAPSDEEGSRNGASVSSNKRQRVRRQGRTVYYPGGSGGGGEWEDADSEDSASVSEYNHSSKKRKTASNNDDDESWQQEEEEDDDDGDNEIENEQDENVDAPKETDEQASDADNNVEATDERSAVDL